MENQVSAFEYVRPAVPNTSLPVLVRLGRTLLREQPSKLSPVVVEALERLGAALDEADEVLLTRFKERNPAILATGREFDSGTDIGWVTLRKLLAGYRDFYGHPGLAALPPALADSIGLDKLRAKAKLADELHERLFGAEGTRWVKLNWMVQAQTMATLLRLIESEGLHAQLVEVGAGELLAILQTLQIHYEDIVAERMARRDRPSDDFHRTRATLRWHIARYQSALETLLDPSDPELASMVDTAMDPIRILSERLTTAASTEQLDELLDDEAFEPLPEGAESSTEAEDGAAA